MSLMNDVKSKFYSKNPYDHTTLGLIDSSFAQKKFSHSIPILNLILNANLLLKNSELSW